MAHTFLYIGDCMSNIVLCDLYDFMIDRNMIVLKKEYSTRSIKNFLIRDTTIYKDGLVAGIVSISRLKREHTIDDIYYDGLKICDVERTKYHCVTPYEDINESSIEDLCHLISSKMHVYSFKKIWYSISAIHDNSILSPNVLINDAPHVPLNSKAPFILRSEYLNRSFGKYARRYGNINMDIYENTKKLLGEK